MTEREFKKVVRSDNVSENTFNYLLVIVFFILGIYWLFAFEFNTSSVYKLILKILSVVLPFLFAISILKGLASNSKIIIVYSTATVQEKQLLLVQYLDTKKKYDQVNIEQTEIQYYEYYTSFGIPVCLYVCLEDEKMLLSVRRKDNFSIREIFDYGVVRRARKKLKDFLEKNLH